MSHSYARQFPLIFPQLGHNFKKKSCPTNKYNCIAWAMSECRRPWWPGVAPEAYWPPGLPPDETIENFVHAFQGKGYRLCEGAHFEFLFEKVALYADRRGTPTHAARLSWTGEWISKIGQNVDIKHDTLQGLEGGLYGSVVHLMKRRWTPARIVTAAVLSIRTSSRVRGWLKRR